MKADFNEDLRESFLSYGLYLNLKKTIKNKYLEVCMEEKKKSLEKQEDSTFYPDLKGFIHLVLCAQADLKKQLDVDVVINRMAFDAETFGSLDWVIQYCYCADNSQYKRMISKYGATGFMRVYPMPGGNK